MRGGVIMKKRITNLSKGRKETIKSVLFAARAVADNGESNCCKGKLTGDCHGNGKSFCCN